MNAVRRSEEITLKKYEAVFILDIRRVEDEGITFSNELTALIASLGGKMISADSMGRQQFTYEIKKRKAGIYYDYVFEAEESSILAIKEKYHLDERVLRNMIIIYDRPEKVTGRVKDLKEIVAPAASPATGGRESAE